MAEEMKIERLADFTQTLLIGGGLLGFLFLIVFFFWVYSKLVRSSDEKKESEVTDL